MIKFGYWITSLCAIAVFLVAVTLTNRDNSLLRRATLPIKENTIPLPVVEEHLAPAASSQEERQRKSGRTGVRWEPHTSPYGFVRVYDEVPDMKHGKALILMSGHMRTYRATLPTIRNKLASPNEAHIVLASYAKDGFKVFREAKLKDTGNVDYDLVADLLFPYLRVVHVVTDAEFVHRDIASRGIAPLLVPALSQFFIMELCLNTSKQYPPRPGHIYQIYIRIRPDMYILGRHVLYHANSVNYTCDTALPDYTTEWVPSDNEVLVSPHHPLYRWKESFADHTISLQPSLGERFFRLYSHIVNNARGPYSYIGPQGSLIAERAWSKHLAQLGVPQTKIHRVPGWHIVLRNQTNFRGGAKAASRNELKVLGTLSVDQLKCPDRSGALIDIRRRVPAKKSKKP